MTEERQPSADQVWDAWTAARGADPLITPRVFARRFGEHAKAVRRELELALALEAARPPGSAFEHVGGEGELRFDAYTVTGEIGRGGFGVVYRAEGPSGEVAVKVLNPLLSAGAEQEARLLEEARMLKRLDHPNVVALHECGLTRGVFWIAMELVRGVQLDQLPALAPAARHARTLALGLALCDGLAHAHDAGIVHCDLKPSNVMLDADGVLKVLDFGFAERPEVLVSVSSSEAGAPLSRGGTPAFMAPEQLDPEGAPGPLTDVHGIGYLLLLLSRPEVADEMRSSKRLTRLRLGEVAELPRACFAGLPRDLAVVVRRCLEPEPEYRYPSVAALREDLQALHDGKPLVHGGPGPARRAWRRARRRPRAFAAAGAVLLVATVLWHQLVYDPSVPVRIDTHLSGKQLWLNGEPLGVAPLTTYLRAGRYELTAQWKADHPTFRANFEVERGQPAAVTFPFNPHEREGWVQAKPYVEVPEGAGAWVRVATQALEGDPVFQPTRGDGATLHGVPGYVAIEVGNYANLRLAFGTYDLELHASGRSAARRTLVIDDERMRFWTVWLDGNLDSEGLGGGSGGGSGEEQSAGTGRVGNPREAAELEREGDPGERTLVVYGPFEEAVEDLVLENARIYVESELRLEDGAHVYKRYFGPIESGLEARVEFWVAFDGPLERVRMDAQISQWRNTWLRIELGPDPERAIPVAALEGGGLERPGMLGKPEEFDYSSKLWPLVRGEQRLFVRLVMGPAQAGEQFAFAQALRTEGGPELNFDLDGALPNPVSGEANAELWSPALTFRYKTL